MASSKDSNSLAMKARVLFVCIGNAGRSRMAEAFFNDLAPEPAAGFAGTHPEPDPHPEVVEAMKELGIEITPGPGRLLTFEMLDDAELVIAMGCDIQDACPGADANDDWGLPDPANGPIERVREVRDEIRRRVEALIDDMYGTNLSNAASK